jgi:hypothetical protein
MAMVPQAAAAASQPIEEDDVEISGGNKVSGLKEVCDIQCSICSRMYPLSKMFNAGDKQYPSWRDKQCGAAVRHLERAFLSKGSLAVQRLALLRKNKKVQFKRMVCIWRINWPEDAPCEFDGDDSLFEGDSLAKSFEITKSEGAEDKVWVEISVALLTKRQFVGYHVTFELYTDRG